MFLYLTPGCAVLTNGLDGDLGPGIPDEPAVKVVKHFTIVIYRRWPVSLQRLSDETSCPSATTINCARKMLTCLLPGV